MSTSARSLFSNFVTTNSAPEGDMPRDLAITPDGSQVFIANRDTNTVSIFDVDSMAISNTVDVGNLPVDIEISPDGQYAVTPNVLGNSVSIIDIQDLSVVDVPVTGDQPYTVRISEDSAFAYVGVINDAISSAISIVNLSSMTEVSSFSNDFSGCHRSVRYSGIRNQRIVVYTI